MDLMTYLLARRDAKSADHAKTADHATTTDQVKGKEILVDDKIPAEFLPSYVDDIEEYDGISSFPNPGESGKIYVDSSTNKVYRWSGTQYIEVSANEDNKVQQTATDTEKSPYEILFSGTADNTTRTEGVRKSNKLTFNPGSGALEMGNTSITDGSINFDGDDFWGNYSTGGLEQYGDGGHFTTSVLSGYTVGIELFDETGGVSALKQININGDDIVLSGNASSQTWDGTNTSLKSAIAAAAAGGSMPECYEGLTWILQQDNIVFDMAEATGRPALILTGYTDIVTEKEGFDTWGDTGLAGLFSAVDNMCTRIAALEQGGGSNVADVYVNGVSVLDANNIAQLKGYVEVTQAEYDALPASKLTDGIPYYITDSKTGITDVKVNGVSVIDNNGVANIIVADEKVKQTNSSDNQDYRILLSGTANDTEATTVSYKNAGLTYNPSLRSFTQGIDCIATTSCAHAEGYETTANEEASHAEGGNTYVNAPYGHAEGENTHVYGDRGHAEGDSTTALGYNSHAEGLHTIASHRSQHVFGMFNIEDPKAPGPSNRGNYIEIVGNGNATTALSNARTLDWDGNEVLSGALTTTDVTLPSGSTWDGTNTSLKDAITAANTNTTYELSKTGNDMILTGSDGSTSSAEVITVTKEIPTGDISSFSGAAALPMPSLKIGIEPQQDLHGYDSPWVGGSGKNKFNIATISVKEYIGGNGNLYSSNNWSVSDFISVDSETAYVLSGITNSGSLAKHAFYDSNKVFISEIDSTVMNFTTPSNAKYIRLSLQSETPTNVQLEKGTTATSYAPYSNICPISGFTEANVSVVGKNLVESTLANTTISNIGEIKVATFDMHIAKIKKGKTYTIQSDESQNVNQKFVGGFFYNMPQLGSISYNNARLANTPATFTAPIDGYVAFRTSHNYTFAQIEFGSTATAYEPYNPNSTTYTIDLNGTRYGGEVDVVSGVLTVDRAYVDLGTLNWTKYNVTEGALFRSSLLTIKTSPNSSYFPNILCSKYVTSTQAERTNGTISQAVLNQGVDIIDNAYSDAETFKAAMSGVQLVYELATPIEVQLTPTQVNSLLGSNNIWADCGNIKGGSYATAEMGELAEIFITDVKVNGTSVVDNNGVANIGIADTKVKQESSGPSTYGDYRVLLSKSDNDTEETDTIYKGKGLTYNPSSGQLELILDPNTGMYFNAYDGEIVTRSQINNSKRTMSINGDDIELSGSGNTWDGTNTSLKGAIAAAASNEVLFISASSVSDATHLVSATAQVIKYNLTNPAQSIEQTQTVFLNKTYTDIENAINAGTPIILWNDKVWYSNIKQSILDNSYEFTSDLGNLSIDTNELHGFISKIILPQS